MFTRTIAIAALVFLSACSDKSDTNTPAIIAMDESQNEMSAVQTNIITTASGLQYEVLRSAEGAKPIATSTVTVHYAGTLTDGTEFDSSYSRGQPATFPLINLIQGWQEGLQLMTVGSQYKFYVPSNLAYGERGTGASIGPNEDLIFIIDLLEINAN